MIRSRPLRRGAAPKKRTPLKRAGRIKPKKRSASEFARIYGSRERVEFVKRSPCVARNTGVCDGLIENAHTRTGGIGRKADATTIAPLCRKHHREYDEHRGVLAFPWARHLIITAAAETERLWQSHTQRSEDDAA